MKKKILFLLALFSLVVLAGGTYLAYSFERSFSDMNKIIMLHHVENLREHLLLGVERVEIDLFSQATINPESTTAIEGHVWDVDKTIRNCYNCHHKANVLERLDDLRQQIDQYKQAVSSALAVLPVQQRGRNIHIDAHIIGESLIGKVETMVVATTEKLNARTEESLKKAERMKMIMLALLAAGPVMMIIFAVTVMRGVTSPVQVLLTATRTLKKGDLEHRVPPMTEEFGELAIAFNDMASALRVTIGAIEESEKRYRLLFESAADAIFILEAEGDQAGRILQANQAAALMHGFKVDELTGMKIQDLDTPESAADAPSRMERVLSGEWIKLEMQHRRKDGTRFPVEVSAGLLETGGHKFILAMDRDITERKRAERDLQRMERIRVSGELATGLAHEIKNPLAGIKVSMEVLSQEASLSDEDRDVLNRVVGEIKRIEFLMKGLLNFANPPKPQLLSTDVNNILETVAVLVLQDRSRDRKHPIHLARDLQNLPETMADPMQLKQIFMNLILNAVDAMPDGGTLTMRTFFLPATHSLGIQLSDTGKGIDTESIGRIFDPFFTTKAKGTGLGLSITKRLVEDHGGSIRIRNNDEGGVTCSILLPVRQPEGAILA